MACALTGRLLPPVHSSFPFSVGLFVLADVPLLFQRELYSQDDYMLEAWSIGSPRMPEGECWNLAGTAFAGSPL